MTDIFNPSTWGVDAGGWLSLRLDRFTQGEASQNTNNPHAHRPSWLLYKSKGTLITKVYLILKPNSKRVNKWPEKLIAISEPFVNNIISFQIESPTGGDGKDSWMPKENHRPFLYLYWGSCNLNSKAKTHLCLFCRFHFVARLACDSLCSHSMAQINVL